MDVEGLSKSLPNFNVEQNIEWLLWLNYKWRWISTSSVTDYFYLGCGFARYKENDKTESTAVFVCNFAKEGNVLNQPIYEIGKNVCGNCGPGFKCEDDLKDGTLGALCIEI